MDIKRGYKVIKVNIYKSYYHNCEVCGRMINDWEYRVYGRCNNCRW